MRKTLEKDLYKLLNNSVLCKTMENLLKRLDAWSVRSTEETKSFGGLPPPLQNVSTSMVWRPCSVQEYLHVFTPYLIVR